MSFVQAVVLGIVQGLTEFLPVSSSGHLVIMKRIFAVETVPLLFDVLLHVATLVVVCLVFRERLGRILVSLGRWIVRKHGEPDAVNLRLVWVIIVATVCTGALGLLFGTIEAVREPKVVSVLFLVTAAALTGTRFVRGSLSYGHIGLRVALATGVAQGFGVLPGISRSGITISAALYSGVDRSHAGEFSFLLSIPAILAALAVTLRDAGQLAAHVSPGALIGGIASAFLVGWLALLLLLRLVRGGKLYFFSLYLVPLGIAGLLLL